MTDDVRRRRPAQRKFSLLLSPITIPSPNRDNERGGKVKGTLKYFILLCGPALVVLFWIRSGENRTGVPSVGQSDAGIHKKYSKANVVKGKRTKKGGRVGEDEAIEANKSKENDGNSRDGNIIMQIENIDSRNHMHQIEQNESDVDVDVDNEARSPPESDLDAQSVSTGASLVDDGEEKKSIDQEMENEENNDADANQTTFDAFTPRPFQYIGDIDPTKPLPWPEEEKDWWSLHETLVQRVRDSDALSPRPVAPPDGDLDFLPQLIFYGDSITEAWNGTSFGNLPGPTRMWTPGEPTRIREVFARHFGENSTWGQKALKPPLILGISGSRTYDFLWRVENGEFPTSQMLDQTSMDVLEKSINASESEAADTFKLHRLERIYIVLMGTNNIGGGMLPQQTIEGMDAVGRDLLKRIQETSRPGTPSALLFSELLPRKDDFRAEKMCPPRCKNLTTLEPYHSFMPAIKKVNEALPAVVEGWARDFPNSRIVLMSSRSKDEAESDADGIGVLNSVEDAGVHTSTGDQAAEEIDNRLRLRSLLSSQSVPVVRCGREMFAIEDDVEFEKYMPDRLHPNTNGYDLWANCLKRGLEVVMNEQVN